MSDRIFNGPLAELLRAAVPPGMPDPWDASLDASVRARDAVPLCLSCLRPQDGHYWFCPNCGFPAGNYAATMPFVYVYLEGEFWRRGVSGPPERGIGRHIFLTLYSAAAYGLFAPVYWFWMIRKAKGRPICEVWRKEYVPAVAIPDMGTCSAEPRKTSYPSDI